MIDLHGFGHQLLLGLMLTVELALCSLFLGLVLGVLGALSKTSKSKALQAIGGAYTTIIRGIPELLVVLLIYFGATTVLMGVAGLFGYHEYIELNAFLAGVIALGLMFGGYATEIFRGALQAIPQGQFESSMVLGMPTSKSFFRIILPQVWRVALPGLGNLFLVLLKDTALVSVVGLDELMRKSSLAVSFTKEPFTFYMAAACLYLILTSISMLLIHRMENWANKGMECS